MKKCLGIENKPFKAMREDIGVGWHDLDRKWVGGMRKEVMALIFVIFSTCATSPELVEVS